MASQPETPTNPLIVILALDKATFYNDLHTDFNKLLKRHATVEYATTPAEARAFFNRTTNKPSAILAADASLTVSTCLTLVHDAAAYVRSGGTLVFMGLFPTFSLPSNLAPLFAQFGLPWRSGDYHRAGFGLNPGMAAHFETGGLAGGV